MHATAASPILLLGDPRLRQRAEAVLNLDKSLFLEQKSRLQSTLQQFRATRGFGRAIAAPQIGVSRRLLALDIGEGPFCMLNPEITWRSDETVTMWDDCMSFPFLLVRVRRHASVSVRYTDEAGVQHVWERLPLATAELLQHEIDHLDGILALDRALDRDAFVSRELFEQRPELFRKQVDYVIGAGT